ncbi:MAG: hypothetical protein HDR88_06655 [Bacteroides sp.]|nr:hypothetical protein [Bacteroides sp.]
MKRLVLIFGMILFWWLNGWSNNLKIEYWFDSSQIGLTEVDLTNNEITFTPDVSVLSPGYHVLYYRIINNAKSTSPLCSHTFYLPYTENDKEVVTYLDWWFDTMNVNPEVYKLEGENTVMQIDASYLDIGFHQLFYQLRNGECVSSLLSTVFYRGNGTSEIEWCKYWWNDSVEIMESLPLTTGTIVSLDDCIYLPDYIISQSDHSQNTAVLNLIFGTNEGFISDIITAAVDYNAASIKVISPVQDWSVNYDETGSYIIGLSPGIGIVRIYTLNGIQIYSSVPSADSVSLSFLDSGTYIVTYAGQSNKIIL